MKISYSNNTHICVLVLLENKGVILHNYKADMRRSEVNSFFWNVFTIPVELNIMGLIVGNEPTAQTMSQKSSRALDMSSFPL